MEELFELNDFFFHITCYFCFESFEIYLEPAVDFDHKNSEIIDCTVCCNPNKIDYECSHGEITSLIVSDGNA